MLPYVRNVDTPFSNPDFQTEKRILAMSKKGDAMPAEIIHLHASMSGPPVANQLFLIKKEFERNPNLKRIIGVHQSFVPTAKLLNYWLS